MVSFIAVPSANFMAFHHQPISYLNNPSIFSVVSVINPPKLDHPLRSKTKQLKHRKQNQNQNQMLFEFSGFSGVVMMCKNWEGESDPNLELQVLEFMKNSKNPKKFPSKKEMIDCGKSDLVEEIMKRGGWMTVGWEDDDEENYDEKVICESGLNKDFDVLLEKNGKNNDVVEVEEKSGSYYKEERHFNGQSSFLNNSSSIASSSGRPLELVTKDEGGIEGILHRLERQRDRNFGYKLGKNGAMEFVGGELRENGRSKGDSCHPQRIERASFNHDIPLITGDGLKKLCSNGFSRSLKSDAWRTWSIQRAGCSDSDFEAGEIDFGENTNQGIVDKSKGEIFAISMEGRRAQDDTKDLDFSHREITQGDLRTRLQHLEVELSSVLHSLRSNTSDLPGKEKEHLSEEWRKLSDVSEFQENEMMNAQDKLRTLRAKLAVLEGKMSLAIMDAQYVLDEKQKRINDARRALQLLRTTCIVWPNHGSEVLLAGSFDGWATQRKMTKSSTGIFSLCLKLYPGKYEIKFIVDGVWKVDPLRPIVNNNGFENNLLTIT